MSTPATEHLEGDIHIGRDDFALGRVPARERHHWFAVWAPEPEAGARGRR